MTSYRELRRKILSVLSQPPYRYNVPYLSRLLGVDRTLVHKLARQLEQKGIVKREKFDGLTWLSLKHKTLYETLKWDVEFYTRKISREKRVDLITYKRVSQTSSCSGCSDNHGESTQLSSCVGSFSAASTTVVSQPGPRGDNHRHKIKWPRRAHWARVQAFRILVRRRQLTIDDYIVVNRLFNAYLEDTSSRVILLYDELNGETLWLPYVHRFTRQGVKRLIWKFNRVFDKANKFHVGVWLTLTVDPKKYRNVVEIRYEAQKAWNRFMSWVAKKLGRRPQYIRVIEFTKTGLIHFHVLLLGVKRIADKFKELTPELERVGLGKISYLYVVLNRNGKWIPKKLLEAEKGTNGVFTDGAGLPRNLKSYLKKYLTKALGAIMDSSGVDEKKINPVVLYWAMNTRFFSYSKQLKPRSFTRLTTKLIIYDKMYSYLFLGTGYITDPINLPLRTDRPPWDYHILYTYPPIYDPFLIISSK